MIYIRKLIKDDVCFLNSVRNECAEKYLHDSRTFSIQDILLLIKIFILELIYIKIGEVKDWLMNHIVNLFLLFLKSMT